VQDGDVVALEQELRELRAGARALPRQRRAQRLEVGVQVEGPDGGRQSAPAPTTCSYAAPVTRRCRRRLRATWSRTSSGSPRTYAAASCIGAARLDHTSLAIPLSAAAASAPSGPSGSRQNPIR
jgi:hypothetical protein